MKYKLFVTDMDGTLLNSKSELSEENKRALLSLHERGIHLAIATGRIFTTAKVYAKHLGIVTPIICSNGAIAKNLENGKTIYSNPMDKETCMKVVDICKENNIDFYFYSEDTIFCEHMTDRLLYFSEWGKTLDEEDRIKLEIVNDSKKIIEKETIYKFGIQDDDIDLLNKVGEIINNSLEVSTFKSWSNLLDIMNKGVSKANAVDSLAKSLGIKREEVVTIGDNENDMSMIEYAGVGIAMGNAIDMVKEVADYITDTNDNNGVAKAIDKFFDK